MKILIAGGTGFIGSHLAEYFLKQGHHITILTRNIHKKYPHSHEIKLIDHLNDINANYNVILNFAGETLFNKRWTPEFKKIIRDSRIATTHKIIHYIKCAETKPEIFVSGSAVGFYGDNLEAVFTEVSTAATKDFSHELCQDWEATALQAEKYGVRVCLSRTGVVLAKNGGILKKMITPFQLGLGAILGTGKQWTSWIHIQDFVAAIDFFIQHKELKGPFNLTAPYPVTNTEFTKTLAKTLNRPSFLKFPPILIKILFGEMGETILLHGQKVLPEKLQKAGFHFQFPILEKALQEIFSQPI